MLEPIDEGIWVADGDCVNFYGFAYPTRCIVVRLGSGDLWVWSPIALKDALAQQVNALGPVKHLVSPNKLHHLFLNEWASAYPDALLWGPDSTIQKRRDLSFHAALTDAPPTAWASEIDQAHIEGSPAMDEIVFFHHASRTAILADFSENFSEDFLKQHWSWWQRPIARVWKIVEGRGYAPLEWRLSFFDRKKVRKACAQILDWQPERVVMAHGIWQRSGGTDYLKQAFAWVN